MARNFQELRDKMSPGARQQAERLAKKDLEEMPEERICQAILEKRLTKPWIVSRPSLGHGHYHYVVWVDKGPDNLDPEEIVECHGSEELAQHIVNVHNDSLAANSQARAACQKAITALNDWLGQYAPEQHTPSTLRAAATRVQNAGGMLAYTAEVLGALREIVNLSSNEEMEHIREKHET